MRDSRIEAAAQSNGFDQPVASRHDGACQNMNRIGLFFLPPQEARSDGPAA